VFGNQLWGDGGFGHGKILNSIKLCNSRVNFRAKLNFNLNKVKLSAALGNQKPKSTGSPLGSFHPRKIPGCGNSADTMNGLASRTVPPAGKFRSQT
jgi:hypothetical protein